MIIYDSFETGSTYGREYIYTLKENPVNFYAYIFKETALTLFFLWLGTGAIESKEIDQKKVKDDPVSDSD